MNLKSLGLQYRPEEGDEEEEEEEEGEKKETFLIDFVEIT